MTTITVVDRWRYNETERQTKHNMAPDLTIRTREHNTTLSHNGTDVHSAFCKNKIEYKTLCRIYFQWFVI